MGKTRIDPTLMLTPREAAFVTEYMFDRNGTAAALRAGYGKGTNASTAASMASRILLKPAVIAAIEGRMKAVAKQTETDSAWVRRRLKEEASNFEKGSNPAARVRALELVGKLNGDFVEDRKNLRTPLQDFDTAQLEALEQAIAELPAVPPQAEPGPTTH